MEKFDVFLSFRGMDTRRGFMSHLYHALSKQQIRIFKNDEDDKKGNDQVLRLIEKSKIAIPVISKNYTDSLSCLRELKKMIECKEKGSLVILPVFYEVDPTDFTNKAYTLAGKLAQNHSFLDDLDLRFWDRSKRKDFDKWEDFEEWMLRRALEDLVSVYKAYANGVEEDAEMIDKVMDYITGHLRRTRSKQIRMRSDSETIEPKSSSWNDLSTTLPIARPIQGSQRNEEKLTSVKTRLMERCLTGKDSVPVSRVDMYIGMDRRMKELNKLLGLDSKDGVCEIGIWGMEGSGKTLLASCVYEHISPQFQDYYYYSVNNTNNNKSSSLTCTAVLEEITRASPKKPMSQSNVTWNCDVVSAKLGHRKALLVVDGIDCIDQLKHITMVGRLFGPGSRLILVTRNKSLLIECQVKHLYQVKSLRYDEALQLFLQIAFKSEDIPKGFDEIFHRAVVVAGRLPLAIKVLGSLLQGRPIKEWEPELLKLEATRDKSFEQVSSRIKYPPKPNPYGKEEERHKFPSYHIV